MSHVRELADAVLHEGYLLYPYAAQALKNLHRYPFGTLYPEDFCRVQDAGDAGQGEFECVVVGGAEAPLSAQIRFLQVLDGGAAVREADVSPAPLAGLVAERCQTSFEFPPIAGEIAIAAAQIESGIWKLSVRVWNSTRLVGKLGMSRDDALRYALCSAHVLLRLQGAEFVSVIDPPARMKELAGSCRSTGLWPVLVGKPGTCDTLLAAPIILYDYPELAPESPGDFFDGTEIDELLTLRILTLTDEEKGAMAQADPRARALLERTETSGLAGLGELHGRMRTGAVLRRGAPVRLHPRGRADIFDLALAGKRGTIQAVERDFEGRIHVAVTVDDDPGKDLGEYGHRFFFKPEELELL